MRVKASLRNIAIRALAQSLEVPTMVHVARRILGDYDIHRQTGFPPSVAVPNRTAAARIIDDIIAADIFPNFVELLIEISENGFVGRRYRIHELRELYGGMVDAGYSYNAEARKFVEDVTVQRSSGWGILQDGTEYLFTLLKADIAGNSTVVRENPPRAVTAAYARLNAIVRSAVEKRDGRIWEWEGDGGIAAFYLENRSTAAVLAGMEMVHELFFYNLLENKLAKPLRVRISVHAGACDFRPSIRDMRSETIRHLDWIDSTQAEPQTLTVSDTAFATVDSHATVCLEPFDAGMDRTYFRYRLELEPAGTSK